MRDRKRLRRWVAPEVSPDGESVFVGIETTDGTLLDLSIPFGEIGDWVGFLVGISSYVRLTAAQGPPRQSNAQTLSSPPIQIEGLELASGDNPDETFLHVQLFGFFLRFALSREQMAKFAADLSRTALGLSARSDRLQ
jgi:hypothetical protein